MSRQDLKTLLIPLETLSEQQRQIYSLYCRKLSNKEIAGRLGLDQRVVATQLSRIKKKAKNLPFTYKIDPGAEHALQQTPQGSPARRLMKKIQEDPGFFHLMFKRYAGNEETSNENKYRLASAGRESSLLLSARAKQIKTLGAPGRVLKAVKMGKRARQVLRDYLNSKNILPVQMFWDDDSAIYLVKPHEIKMMQQLLNRQFES